MGASSGLPPRASAGLAPLLSFAAAMSAGASPAARRALRAARRAGAPRVAAEEVALMLVLHAGYPAALEAARLLDETWPGRPRRTREGGPRAWMRRGERLCRRVYGAAYPKLKRNVERLHPDLAVWMIEQGYGRVLGRTGLRPVTRELVAVTVLGAGCWERQLVSHLLGAARLGATPAEIRRAFAAGVRRGSADTRACAARAWSTAFGPR